MNKKGRHGPYSRTMPPSQKQLLCDGRPLIKRGPSVCLGLDLRSKKDTVTDAGVQPWT